MKNNGRKINTTHLYSIDSVTTGRYLRAKRREFGLTLEELAAEVGISKTAVSNWESGKSVPKLDHLFLLAQMYQCSMDELIISCRPCPARDAEGDQPSPLVTIAFRCSGGAIPRCFFVNGRLPDRSHSLRYTVFRG